MEFKLPCHSLRRAWREGRAVCWNISYCLGLVSDLHPPRFAEVIGVATSGGRFGRGISGVLTERFRIRAGNRARS